MVQSTWVSWKVGVILFAEETTFYIHNVSYWFFPPFLKIKDMQKHLFRLFCVSKKGNLIALLLDWIWIFYLILYNIYCNNMKAWYILHHYLYPSVSTAAILVKINFWGCFGEYFLFCHGSLKINSICCGTSVIYRFLITCNVHLKFIMYWKNVRFSVLFKTTSLQVTLKFLEKFCVNLFYWKGILTHV